MRPERRLWKPDVTKDVHDELSHHLEMRQREYVARGVDPSEARDIAARRFGDVQSIAAACRDIDERWYREQKRASMWMDLRQDVMYGIRVLRKSPGFVLAAVASLSIGIAATTAAFSLLNAVMFRSLPGVQESSRLVQVFTVAPWSNGGGSDEDTLRHYRRVLPSLVGIAGFSRTTVAVGLGDQPFVANAIVVTDNYFDILGTTPAAGRLIDASVYREPVVVVSHDLALRYFATPEAAAGRPLTVNGVQLQILGVAPPSFAGVMPGGLGEPARQQLWIPLALRGALEPPQPANENRLRAMSGTRWMNLVGRLAPGVTLERARAQAAAVPPHTTESGATDVRPLITPIGRGPRDSTGDIAIAVALVFSVPVIVLVIGCANTANLQLARAANRQSEIAVRRSLGATRGRVVRQLLVESLLVALLAGVAGVAATLVLTRLLAGLVPVPVPVDWRVLLFGLGIGTLTGVAFGIAPALGVTRGELAGPLKDATGSPIFRRSRLRSGLVTAQIALSLLLLVMAGLLTRSVQRLHGLEPDRHMARVAAVQINLALMKYSTEGGRAFQHELVARMEQAPGVVAAAIAPFPPFGGSPGLTYRDPENPPLHNRPYEHTNGGAPLGRFIEAAGLRVVRGRGFTDADRTGVPRVAIVSETLALRLSPAGDAIGRSLLVADGSKPTVPVTVIGVTADAQLNLTTRETHAMFLPSPLNYDARIVVWVRTTGDAALILPHIRSVVREMDPRLPVPEMGTAESWRGRESQEMRYLAAGLGAMGFLALMLAGGGLYAVMSYLVAGRRHEMAVRLALGASPPRLAATIVRDGIRLSIPGLIAGVVLSVVIAYVARAVFFGISPVDPVAFGGVAAMLIVVALAATLPPAIRASKLDPLVTLRRQ